METKIKLENILKVQIVAAQSVDVESFVVDSIEDKRTSKSVNAQIRLVGEKDTLGRNMMLKLWDGDSYDEIGQWTDEQANKRIIELLSA